MRKYLIFIFALALSFTTHASVEDNPKLTQLFNQDQEARQSQDVDWETLDKQDAERREAVLTLLREGELTTGLDYFHAAVIFQHGERVEDIRLAHSLATVSATLEYERAKWLMAASWDRLMMYFEQPQWYGTQFTINESGEWHLYDVNSDIITDEQRADWHVPSLEESEERAQK